MQPHGEVYVELGEDTSWKHASVHVRAFGRHDTHVHVDDAFERILKSTNAMRAHGCYQGAELGDRGTCTTLSKLSLNCRADRP